jgi:hypothetical protein
MIEPAVALGVKQEPSTIPPIKTYAELMSENIKEPNVLMY